MYQWEAILKNGQEIKQKERGDGLNEQERKQVKKFVWINYETGHNVGVDLEQGFFFIGNQILHASWGDVGSLSFKDDYRLIYAVRHFVMGGSDEPENYLYLVGWQFTENGRNIKRILYVYPHGEIIFGGEGNL